MNTNSSDIFGLDDGRAYSTSRALLIVNIYCRNSPPPALLIPNFKSDNGSIVLSMPQTSAEHCKNLLIILCPLPFWTWRLALSRRQKNSAVDVVHAVLVVLALVDYLVIVVALNLKH